MDVKTGLNWSANEIISSVSYLNVRANFINLVNLFAYFIAYHLYYLFKWHCTIIYRGQLKKKNFRHSFGSCILTGLFSWTFDFIDIGYNIFLKYAICMPIFIFAFLYGKCYYAYPMSMVWWLAQITTNIHF